MSTGAARRKLIQQAEEELMPGVIYESVDRHGRNTGGESWGMTPDGIGMIWYETEKEAREHFGEDENVPVIQVTDAQLEEIREGE